MQRKVWRIWAKALGSKETSCNKEADRIALLRTFIFASYLITNCFIVAGVMRHWDDAKCSLEATQGSHKEP